jgi:hypothetical protein
VVRCAVRSRAAHACTRHLLRQGFADGVSTLDLAKALIDEGFHPMTMYFPLVVHGAMLVEPTETESKAALDQFIMALRSVAERCRAGDESLKTAPVHAPRRRLDETLAARKPMVAWRERCRRRARLQPPARSATADRLGSERPGDERRRAASHPGAGARLAAAAQEPGAGPGQPLPVARPALYLAVLAFVLSRHPPGTTGWLLLALGFTIGAAAGWLRGRLFVLRLDEGSGEVLLRRSRWAITMLMGIVALRFLANWWFGPATATGNGALLVTDLMLGLLFGLIAVTRLEIALRARALLAAASGRR